MIVRNVVPGDGDPVELTAPDAAARLDAWYRTTRPAWVRINLVVSVNGNAAGPDGTSATLTVGADRKILGAIRRNSDVVLVGASTVRREGYFLPRTAPLAIVTGTGDLSGAAIPEDIDPDRVLVLCPQSAVETVSLTLAAPVTVIALPGPRLSSQIIVDALRARGLQRIVCEGGPALASQLVDDGLVDELCLTTSPQVNGSVSPALPGLNAQRPARLTQLLVDSSGALYARWAL